MPNPPSVGLLALTALALACGGQSAPPGPGPAPAPPPPRDPILPLATVPFAGQSVAVTPLTLVIATDTLGGRPPFTDRAALLAWADSTVGDALTARGPEVKWVLPAELRRIARRSPTVAPDPDRMGQSVLQGRKVDQVPDPLRSNLRALAAMTGGRFTLVPAALVFVPAGAGRLRAELTLVLADARTGQVIWRTVTWAEGATALQALQEAMVRVLPVQRGS